MDKLSEIPFLRTPINPTDYAKTYSGGFFSITDKKQRQRAKTFKRLAKQEQGWNNYVKPISKYN